MNSIIIYYKNNKIILCERNEEDKFNYDQHDYIFDWDNAQNFNEIANRVFSSSEEIKTCLITKDLNSLLERIKSDFKYVEAAGGLVKNEKNELLIIHRFGMPDLPKGKIEKGEEPIEAAIREVEEECGISDLTVISESEPTFHIFKINNKNFLKKTFWFNMIYKGEAKPTPQTEESITQVEWCDSIKIDKYKDKTYKSLRIHFK